MNHVNPIRNGVVLALAIWACLYPLGAMSHDLDVSNYEANAKDVMRILGVKHLGATVRLPEPMKSIEAKVRLDFYRNGKKLTRDTETGSWMLGTGDEVQTFQISVDFVDTDKIQLADAPKGNTRFFVKLATVEGGSEGSSTIDIPKTEFNAQSSSSWSLITRNDAELVKTEDGRIEVPLICYLSGDNSHMMTTPLPKLLAANPDSDVLVVILVYGPVDFPAGSTSAKN